MIPGNPRLHVESGLRKMLFFRTKFYSTAVADPKRCELSSKVRRDALRGRLLEPHGECLELAHAPGRGGKRRVSMPTGRLPRVWGRLHALWVKRGAVRHPVPAASAVRRRRVADGVGGREGRRARGAGPGMKCVPSVLGGDVSGWLAGRATTAFRPGAPAMAPWCWLTGVSVLSCARQLTVVGFGRAASACREL